MLLIMLLSFADKSVANACMFYRSGTKTWREGQFRLRNVSTNSYWHEWLTGFFSYNLFFPLMIPCIFLQATFFSFTIYNLCSPHFFDFQVNFPQNMQLVTILLIVVVLFTTKNDPFLSAFHNVWMQIKKRMIFDFTLPCSVMCSAAFETLFYHHCVFLFHRWYYLTLMYDTLKKFLSDRIWYHVYVLGMHLSHVGKIIFP